MKTFLMSVLALFLLTACMEEEMASPAPEPLGPVATGEMCGGLAGIQCGIEGDFCRFEQEAQCGAADQMGTCSPKPQKCTRDYRPVCGCDGKTYSNACTASSNGVSVLHDGKCEEAE